MATVRTTPVENHRALRMDWDSSPDKRDVRDAFQQMTELLDASGQPLWVIVDVSSNPRFPLSETITGAFWGSFRNKMLLEWLVVGASGTAHTIGRTLTGITKRDNIRWFPTIDEAMAYLEQAETR
ncbi:MAG: hypothetical protein U0452_07170 [Anaerolineae bacterium]